MAARKHLRHLLERILLARPQASAAEVRRLAPQLRELSDADIEALLVPIREKAGEARKA